MSANFIMDVLLDTLEVGCTSLYRIEPLYAATPWAESLSCMMNRHAEVHRLNFNTYLSHILMTSKYLDNQGRYTNDAPFISQSVKWLRDLDGNCRYAMGIFESLEDLIPGIAIRGLSLKPWLGVFADRNMLRPQRAWCPVCLQDWRDKGDPVYEPALWAVAIVDTCSRHKCSLLMSCQHCGETQFRVEERLIVGHCAKCGKWLGSSAKPIKLDKEQMAWKSFVSVNTGKLIASLWHMKLWPTRIIVSNHVRNILRDLPLNSTSLSAFYDDWVPTFEKYLQLLYRTKNTVDPIIEESKISGVDPQNKVVLGGIEHDKTPADSASLDTEPEEDYDLYTYPHLYPERRKLPKEVIDLESKEVIDLESKEVIDLGSIA